MKLHHYWGGKRKKKKAVLYISFLNRFQISITELCTDWSIKIKASITSSALYAYVHVQLLSQLRLCNTMDYSPPGSSVHGISQARILEWVAVSFSRGFSWPWEQACVSCIGRWILCHLSNLRNPSPYIFPQIFQYMKNLIENICSYLLSKH